jgi:hypothetical protein
MLPYIPERNDKTSRSVACFHDVSIGVYIYCTELCFCIYNLCVHLKKKLIKKNIFFFVWILTLSSNRGRYDHSIIYKFFNPSAPKRHFCRLSLERQSVIFIVGYSCNSTFVVPFVPTIVLGVASGNSWYLGGNKSVITLIPSQ